MYVTLDTTIRPSEQVLFFGFQRDFSEVLPNLQHLPPVPFHTHCTSQLQVVPAPHSPTVWVNNTDNRSEPRLRL